MITNEQIELITQRLLERLSLQVTTRYLVLGKPVNEVTLPVGAKGLDAQSCSTVADVDHVLYYASSWPTVLRLAELVAVSSDEEQLVEALLLGKPVTLYFEVTVPQNKLVQRKLDQALRKLKEYGIELNQPLTNVQKEQSTATTVGTSGKKQLITVDTLMNNYDLTQLSEFKVESNMIVTALAKDFLREHNVTIV